MGALLIHDGVGYWTVGARQVEVLLVTVLIRAGRHETAVRALQRRWTYGVETRCLAFAMGPS
ncbi:hypothetical protein [Kutzneria sp. 744]|uniref:hypothetical protein n=1 Tax=Kutzneria sp. (strain 744) TaxID=345341 RepID=UPI0004ACE249|nr:hypothetical protein [Kutzneria sp. 744]